MLSMPIEQILGLPCWVIPYVKRLMLRRAEKAGMGKHTYEEVAKIGRDDLQALSILIGKRTISFKNCFKLTL